jgi:aminoglycoside phosphotransferase (APT) family kinase protein
MAVRHSAGAIRIKIRRMPELDDLTSEAAEHLGADAITPPEPLPGGASRGLYGFDATRADGATEELVLLVTKGTAPAEYEALRAAFEAGVPVAEPLWLTGDEASIVMRRLVGEAIVPRIFRRERFAAAREVLLGEVAAALAAIHSLPIESVPLAPRRDGAIGEIEAIEAELWSYADPHPALELGLRWLRRHLPAPHTKTVVHGDFRMGNMLVGETGLVAVLDWELVHIGDPAEDLGWFCNRAWRFGRDELAAGGLGDREELLAAYAAAGGAALDVEELRFWEVLAALRWGTHTLRQLHEHLSGQRPSLELAAIGRRTSEAEWDLLAMVE